MTDGALPAAATPAQAYAWLQMLKPFYEAMFANLAAFIGEGRPGEPHDADMITYWRPEEIRTRFQQACAAAGIPEETAIEMQRMGKAGRLEQIAKAGALVGLTAAGRRGVEVLERESCETELGQSWLLACITDDRDTLRRLGAIR